ncbi:hypothetical protein BXZ70DRAFT_1005020 [Cristinia sonorae]|uniref:Uncharacterized protein n=1 Tax=Cristinia sonorae TaxID=1940300 RepID=A0A8K0XSV5_9AGAR|nr:hypothetical protein BXZ70DRAFT_1005020 [Cristinia sonorae]
MQQSSVTRHAVNYFQKNADSLGIAHISQLFIDEDDNKVKFTVASCRSPQPEWWPVHFTLHKIDLLYVYKSRLCEQNKECSFDLNPFAQQGFLPLLSMLDQLLEKFVVYHLVKRYPLIFGLFGQKVTLEMASFKPLAQAVLNIVDRSENHTFRKQCHRILRRLTRCYTRTTIQLLRTSSDYLLCDREDTEEYPSIDNPTDLRLLQLSMLRLFKLRVRPSRFKISLSPSDDVREVGTGASGDAIFMDMPSIAEPSAIDHLIFNDEDWDDSSTHDDDYLSELLIDHDDWPDSDDDLCKDDDMLDHVMEDEAEDLVDVPEAGCDVISKTDAAMQDYSYSEKEQEDRDAFGGDEDLILDQPPVMPFLPGGEDDALGLWLD